MRVIAVGCVLYSRLRRNWHNRSPQFGVRRQQPMKTDQMQARARHQGGEPLHEFQRRYHEVARAVAIRRLQLEHHLPGVVHPQPLVGDGRARDVAAQVLKLAALLGLTAHPRMQAEAVGVGAQGLGHWCGAPRCVLQAQHFVAHNVTINNLLPGPFDTDRLRSNFVVIAKQRGISVEQARLERMKQNPSGRLGDPAEFGDACAYLCSAQAGYVTGQNFLIDGGG